MDQKALNKTVQDIYTRVGKWTDERGLNFIKELILSGDVYTIQRQQAVITENDYPTSKVYDFDFANLWCYEPYREVLVLKNKNKKLLSTLKDLYVESEHDWGGDHSDPDACGKCLKDLGELS